MTLLRFEAHGVARYGLLEGSEIVALVGNPFETRGAVAENIRLAGEQFDLGAVRLLPPCQPGKYVGIGINYHATAEALGVARPERPAIFLKPSTAIIGPGQPIVVPEGSDRVICEAELAVVIGRRARDVPREAAADYILGYTIANDVTDLTAYLEDAGNPTRAKSHDGFAPIGPAIISRPEISELEIEAHLNGRRVQHGGARDMIFDIGFCISYISSVMTLMPGDVIALGTPSAPPQVRRGDTVEIAIRGIGTLLNTIA